MPSKPTRPNAIAKNDRRKVEIIEIAIPLFATLGPDGVSLRDVAEVAGIKVGTLYYYFPEKQKLYQAAVDHALAKSSSLMMEYLAQKHTAREQLASIIDAHFLIFSDGNPIGALADRELLNVAANAPSAQKLSAETIGSFRQSQVAVQKIIAEIAGLPDDAPILDWLQEFVISSIYGVARMQTWYDQTRDGKSPPVEKVKADLRDTLVASFEGIGRTHQLTALVAKV